MKTIPRKIILHHLLGWLAFWMFPFLFIVLQSGGASIRPMVLSPWLWACLAFYISLFYLNTYFLLPRLFFGKKVVTYFIVVILLFLLSFYLRPYDRLVEDVSKRWFGQVAAMPQAGPPAVNGPLLSTPPPRGFDGIMPPPYRPQLDVVGLMIVILVFAAGLALQWANRWKLAVQQAASAELDKAHAELDALKAQVNPHFLFNTLNNIYSLALMKDERTAGSIMELSNMMRYLTDEVTADFVPLKNEVGCIYNYIDLERLRVGTVADTTFRVNGDMEGKKIAPMILLPFIENVFKYGIGKKQTSGVVMRLDIGEDVIDFFCQNKLLPQKQNDERFGTGIANVAKRLDHLYPNTHLLQIDNEDGLYTVRLKLVVR